MTSPTSMMMLHVTLIGLSLIAGAPFAIAQDPRPKPVLGTQDGEVYTKIALGKSGRILQLFDLAQLLPKAPVEGQPFDDRDAVALAGFVRQFLDPAPTAQDDVQIVAGRWLMVLGKAPLLEAAERLVAANLEHREHAIAVDVRITKVTTKLFEQVLRPHLVAVDASRRDARAVPGPDLEVVDPASKGVGPELTLVFAEISDKASTQWQGLLKAKAATGVVDVLIKEGSEHVEMPRIIVSPLRLATVASHSHTSYVRDFEIEQQADRVIASPVVDVVSEGLDGRVMVLFEPDGRIGLDCEVSVTELLRPIPTAEVDLGIAGAPKSKVQLPRTRGVRLRQVAHLANGEVAVVAAPRTEGGYLVAMIAVRTKR